MTTTKVWLADLGLTWSTPNATADVFESGVLTVTHNETDAVVQRFWRDEWTRCSVYGADGYELFAFTNRRFA